MQTLLCQLSMSLEHQRMVESCTSRVSQDKGAVMIAVDCFTSSETNWTLS